MLPEDRDRNIVPRWRSPRSTALAGELSTGRSPRIQERRDDLLRRQSEWTSDPNLWTAADLLATAISVGDDTLAATSAEYLLSQYGTSLSPSLQFLANSAVQSPIVEIPPSPEMSIHIAISKLRRRMSNSPPSAVSYCELARHYTLLGQRDSAARSMKVALLLSPAHRYILRCAARMYVHFDQTDHALWLVHKFGNRQDPWIASAEIALASSMNLSPRFLKTARQLTRSSGKSIEMSELRTALSRIAADAGDFRQAKRLLADAMVQPTENAIAQAQWLCANRGIDVLKNNLELTKKSGEALSWQLYAAGDFDAAIAPIARWLADQPFSSRPAMLGSFVAGSCLDDDPKAIKFAEQGITANPNDAILWNNLAFSQARSGNLADAALACSRASKLACSTGHSLTILATRGLLAFRQGDLDSGSVLYKQAIDGFMAEKQLREALLACVFWSDELRRCNDPEWIRVLQQVRSHPLSKSVLSLRHMLSRRLMFEEHLH
jgi:hypothetical protein